MEMGPQLKQLNLSLPRESMVRFTDRHVIKPATPAPTLPDIIMTKGGGGEMHVKVTGSKCMFKKYTAYNYYARLGGGECMSRSLDHSACSKSTQRTITMQGLSLLQRINDSLKCRSTSIHHRAMCSNNKQRTITVQSETCNSEYQCCRETNRIMSKSLELEYKSRSLCSKEYGEDIYYAREGLTQISLLQRKALGPPWHYLRFLEISCPSII